MKTTITNSTQETQKFAEQLAESFKNGGIIALTGDLGAGKTTFVQGFAKGLGIKEKVISPTFVLIRQHLVPNTNQTLYHLDLYRLEDSFEQIGLQELFTEKGAIVLIEWSEKIANQLPANATKVNIEKTGESSRKITIS